MNVVPSSSVQFYVRTSKRPLKEAGRALKEARRPLKEARRPLKEARRPLKEARRSLKEARKALKEARGALYPQKCPREVTKCQHAHIIPHHSAITCNLHISPCLPKGAMCFSLFVNQPHSSMTHFVEQGLPSALWG